MWNEKKIETYIRSTDENQSLLIKTCITLTDTNYLMNLTNQKFQQQQNKHEQKKKWLQKMNFNKEYYLNGF